jgi:hypothetical protein
MILTRPSKASLNGQNPDGKSDNRAKAFQKELQAAGIGRD